MTHSADKLPYWRLSSFYFFYFASLGALIPYWGLYLRDAGFSAPQIGSFFAIIMATKVVAPNVWGWIADHTGRGMVIVRFASLAAALTFLGVFFTHEYWLLAGVMALFSFFWNAALPQFEANTMNHLGRETHRYSAVRAWGSWGFIATVVALGPLLKEVYTPALLPWVILALYAAIWVSTLTVPEYACHHRAQPHDTLGRVLRRREVIALLLVAFLIQASHGPYYTFYTLYLSDHGYSGNATGLLWGLGVIAEIGIFMLMPRLMPRVGPRQLMLATLLLTTLRWVLIGAFVDNLVVMLFAQVLHAFSFGVFHAVSIHLIHKHFVGRNQGRGQALYSSLSFGAGGAVGSLFSGWIWEEISPGATYYVAAVVVASGLSVAWWGIHSRE